MDPRLYRFLKWTAILLTVAWLGWTVYDSYLADSVPGDEAALAGDRFFADQRYEKALGEYDAALRENPDHTGAMRAKGRTLVVLKRYQEALPVFDEAIARDPDFAGTYANRGIMFDHMGRYEEALADYERAIRLDAEAVEGPGWMTRFFRLQPEKPPSVIDRASYLRAELAKPKEERLLRVPELDEQQRPHKP